MTIIPGGRIAGGSITDSGVVVVLGSSTSVGTAVTVILSPSIASGRIMWSCSTGGNTSTWKYVPAECRH